MVFALFCYIYENVQQIPLYFVVLNNIYSESMVWHCTEQNLKDDIYEKIYLLENVYVYLTSMQLYLCK